MHLNNVSEMFLVRDISDNHDTCVVIEVYKTMCLRPFKCVLAHTIVCFIYVLCVLCRLYVVCACMCVCACM